MARLNEKDLSLLSVGKTISLGPGGGAGYAYLGGEFSTNPNDYIQVSIYDTNENFLESFIASPDDYLYDTNERKVKLKTGTILRKMGYDRGRYVVKYNFLRRLAGSYENVLVDENNIIYTGPFDQNNPEDRAKIGNTLFIKEYKYFIHEISDSRKEVRLVPQRIEDTQYKDDFYELQTELKRIDNDGTIRFVGDSNVRGDSLQLEYVDVDTSARDPNKSFPPQVANGVIAIHQVFSQPLKTSPPPPYGEQDVDTDPSDPDTYQQTAPPTTDGTYEGQYSSDLEWRWYINQWVPSYTYTGPGSSDPYTNQCFTETALVFMADGTYKRIVNIKEGDKILTFDEKIQEYSQGTVTDFLVHDVNDFVTTAKLTNKEFDYDELIGAIDHPIYHNGRWSEIQDSKVEFEIINKFIDKYYNLEVDGHNIVNGNHNYIVNGYIVSGLGDNLVLNKTYPRQDVFKDIAKKYNG